MQTSSPDWMGYDPFAVSPDNMTQSAPSRTALATSLTSARVGRGLYYNILSFPSQFNALAKTTYGHRLNKKNGQRDA